MKHYQVVDHQTGAILATHEDRQRANMHRHKLGLHWSETGRYVVKMVKGKVLTC